VDVVADAGAVGGVVAVAEDGEFLAFADDDLLHEGEEVVGVLEGLVAQQVGLVRSAGVEIAQGDHSPVLMCAAEGGQQHLHTGLGLSIGTAGQFEVGLGAVILIAVDASSGGEDEALAVGVLLHEFKEIHGAHHVVLVVEHGLGVGLSDRLLRREVHNRVDGFAPFHVLLEDAVQELEIHDVALMETHTLFDLIL
jgi:hypothetical protein